MKAGTTLVFLVVGVIACGCLGADSEQQLGSTPGQLAEEKIAFVSNRDGDSEIFVMNPDGSGVRQLTRNFKTGFHDTAEDSSPAWSPDGRMIAFTSKRHKRGDRGEDYEVYVMKRDGSGERRLSDASDGRTTFAPDWLPDGRVIFPSCKLTGDEPQCDVVAIEPDGSNPERLSEQGLTFEVRPSPDGSKLLLSRLRGHSHYQHMEIYVTDADGEDERLLTENNVGDASPTWSPDGERIAFVSNRAPSARCLFHDCTGYTNELYVMDADGSDVTRLTKTPDDEGSPAWSPDGTRLIYSRILGEGGSRDLWVVNADGSCPRKVSRYSGFNSSPDWYGPAGAAESPLSC